MRKVGVLHTVGAECGGHHLYLITFRFYLVHIADTVLRVLQLIYLLVEKTQFQEAFVLFLDLCVPHLIAEVHAVALDVVDHEH